MAVFCELEARADTSRSESSQLHRRLLGVVGNVTGNVYSFSGCFVSSCEQHKISNMCGHALYADIAYSLRSRHENKTLKWVWSWWACEIDYEQRQRLWYIEWKYTIKNICIQASRLRRLTVPGTVLEPQFSIIPDLDRLCNNPWKESLIVWGDIYMWHLRRKKLKQVGENAAWKYKSWPANNSSRTGLVMQDGHRIHCPG